MLTSEGSSCRHSYYYQPAYAPQQQPSLQQQTYVEPPSDASPLPAGSAAAGEEVHSDEYSEYARLASHSDVQVRCYRTRISPSRMELSAMERDCTAYCIQKTYELKREGREWKLYGDRLYASKVVAAALVPVLIGVLGSFDSNWLDAFVRFAAIVLSITGTIAVAIEDVYQFRLRGMTRLHIAHEMQCLFQEFTSLCGRFEHMHTPHTGAPCQHFLDEYNDLLREARRSTYVGQQAHAVRSGAETDKAGAGSAPGFSDEISARDGFPMRHLATGLDSARQSSPTPASMSSAPVTGAPGSSRAPSWGPRRAADESPVRVEQTGTSRIRVGQAAAPSSRDYRPDDGEGAVVAA